MENLIRNLSEERTRLMCGPSNHAAYLVKNGKNKMNFISRNFYGENHYQIGYETTHAEMDVINKVSKKHVDKAKKRHKEVYNLIVIRVSKSKVIGNSKVCKNCLDNILLSSKRTGIKIKKIFYSNKSGNIIKSTPTRMLNDDDIFVSSFYNTKGFNSIYEKIKAKRNNHVCIPCIH